MPRKITGDEQLHYMTIEDPFCARRSANSCMVCKNNGKNGLIMPLCCLSFVCFQCLETTFREGPTNCSYCDQNLSSLLLQDVLLAPYGMHAPSTAQMAEPYIKAWKQLLLKAEKQLSEWYLLHTMSESYHLLLSSLVSSPPPPFSNWTDCLTFT